MTDDGLLPQPDVCEHTFIKVTATTYDIPVPYYRCAKCGLTRTGAHHDD
jgi:hypothetical protein